MSDLVARLLAEHLVEEVGRPEEQGVGKPATLVGIVPDARHVVCLDLSDETHFHGSLVNLGGKVLERRTKARKGRTGDAAVDLVADLAAELVEDTRQPLLGIGVGSPGVVDSDGVVVEAARLQWHGVPLGAILADRLPAPVYVTNDANASTLAEFTFGGVEGRSMLLVKIGQGVGAGLLIDGEVFVGDHFAAGEIGHVVIDDRGDSCTCGRRGCLETAVAAQNMRRRLRGQTPTGQANVARAAGRKLGVALATIVSALNLHEVVLSMPTDLAGEPFRVAALDTI